jgi:methylase of polypeptide subunit release factors
LFAILMARMGAGRVYALDSQAEACALTRRNAERNGLADRTDVRQGHLFDPLGPIAVDFIVNDVSGVADAIARRAGWFPDTVPTGGDDGADVAVAMFTDVRRHLLPHGRLLFPVISLSNEGRILEAAQATFNHIEMLEARRFPLAPSVTNAPSFQDLLDSGTIRAMRRGSRWLWELRVFEASAPRFNGTAHR